MVVLMKKISVNFWEVCPLSRTTAGRAGPGKTGMGFVEVLEQSGPRARTHS